MLSTMTPMRETEPGSVSAALGAVLNTAITLYEQSADLLGGVSAYAFLSASTARDDATIRRHVAMLCEDGDVPLALGGDHAVTGHDGA